MHRVQIVVSPATQPPTVPQDADFSSLKEITDMCSTIQQTQPETGCLGFCLDSQGRLRGLYPVEKKHYMCEGVVTLEELLSASPPIVNNKLAKLSLGNRYLLAVTPASSFLQLHATPWIRPEWTRKYVIFREIDDTSGHIIDFQRPEDRGSQARGEPKHKCKFKRYF
jgi:hypothetical protein